MGFIQPEEYKNILEKIAIPCVDAVILIDNKFLLIKRKNEPAKGQWWLPDGRVYKNETLKDAIKRKVKEEIGIDIEIVKKLGVDETIFGTGPFGFGVHTINTFFFCKTINKNIKIDDHHSEYKLFDKIDESWHNYVKNAIRAALNVNFTSKTNSKD